MSKNQIRKRKKSAAIPDYSDMPREFWPEEPWHKTAGEIVINFVALGLLLYVLILVSP